MWSPVIITGVMPGRRAAATAPADLGSRRIGHAHETQRATGPLRLLQLGRQRVDRPLGEGQDPVALGRVARRPRPAARSQRVLLAGMQRAARTPRGRPSRPPRRRLPVARWSVVIRRRRWHRTRTRRPAAVATLELRADDAQLAGEREQGALGGIAGDRPRRRQPPWARAGVASLQAAARGQGAPATGRRPGRRVAG